MNTELSNTAAKILNDMAAALGTTAEHLWPILVRQSILEGVRGIVLFLLSLGALAWLFRWTPKQPKDHWDEVTFSTFLVAGIVGLISVICLICGFIDAWCILNPEYYAAQKVLDAIGGSR